MLVIDYIYIYIYIYIRLLFFFLIINLIMGVGPTKIRMINDVGTTNDF